MSMLRFCILLCALGICALPARAEDEDAGEEVIRREIALLRYRVPPPPVGPRLAVPTDLLAQSGEASDVSIWTLDEVYDNGTWLPFGEPPFEGWALPMDAAVELLNELTQDPATRDATLDLSTTATGLLLEGTSRHVAAAQARMPWILAALAPSVRVSATLFQTEPGAAECLQALGRVRLWPNRWTRVYLQESAVPCVVAWDLEVAQESTTMDPTPVLAAEGQELYLRYHPGQGVALIEVWAGTTTHRSIIRQDVSVVRNVPEANAPGELSYPETAVDRVATGLVLPSGAAAKREIRWQNRGRQVRLALEFTAPPSPASPVSLGSRGAMSTVRTGAVAQELAFGARTGTTGEWEDRISRLYYKRGAAYKQRNQPFQFSLSALNGGSLFVVEAPMDDLSLASAAIEDAERRLLERSVTLRVLRVEEPTFREALGRGLLSIGAALAPEVEQQFLEQGGTVGETISTPVLTSMRVAFRVGHTVPGIMDVNAEIAQSSAGLHPVTTVRFAGLAGEVRVRKTGGGHMVTVSGRITWADREAGTVGLVFRPPGSLSADAKEAAWGGRGHKVKLPLLGGGGAPIEGDVEIPAGNKAAHLLHAHVQGGEVVLLLAVVR